VLVLTNEPHRAAIPDRSDNRHNERTLRFMDKINLGHAVDLIEDLDKRREMKLACLGQDVDQLFEAKKASDQREVETIGRIDAHWRANLMMHLATLTLLIDNNACTIDQACVRIESMHSSFANSDPGFDTPIARGTIEWATQWLRAHQDKPQWRLH
jgi:hypothetical protein